MYLILKNGKTKEKGWIFDILPDNDKAKQIQGEGKILYVIMVSLFSGFQSNGGELSGWKSFMMNA